MALLSRSGGGVACTKPLLFKLNIMTRRSPAGSQKIYRPKDSTDPHMDLGFSFLSVPFNHLPNKFLILEGGGMLKVNWTTCQMSLANLHLINKCSTDSFELQ
jgi:hypothetical protein